MREVDRGWVEPEVISMKMIKRKLTGWIGLDNCGYYAIFYRDSRLVKTKINIFEFLNDDDKPASKNEIGFPHRFQPIYFDLNQMPILMMTKLKNKLKNIVVK